MKLDVDVNEVVLSNVGATGEFKIRNSAKAFKILSDGLYSNKIRAIIRELSCNAVDSHVAAGKTDVPFEVHLPTILEPWFSVRDFGTGLNDHQVVNIYTTYFESTKTDSNDFIGALGLGSKSPFSYTENFTVTAIKDGVRRIYSAFINENGVPSIAKMSEEASGDDTNGVEVKFSVTDRGDYQSFRNEAQNVFKWFEKQPTITGVDNFEVRAVEYVEKNIVPGVHTLTNGINYNYHGNGSIALMGNIAYPLDNIPDTKKHFGDVAELLNCSLVLEFGIGELDFAASREQLSYVPLTLKSIKKKLDELNANLASHLAVKADLIECEWQRAFYLYEQARTKLYSAAVGKYVADTKFELYDPAEYYGIKNFKFPVEDLTKRGLEIRGFHSRGGSTSKTGEQAEYVSTGNGQHAYVKSIRIQVAKEVIIVLNDLKTGCLSRARYHFNSTRMSGTVYCVSHKSADLAERQEEYDKFIAELHTPPTILKASELEKQVRAKPVSTQGIMSIRLKANCRVGYQDSYTWEPYTEEIDEDETYYYVGLSNFNAVRSDDTHFELFSIKSQMDECGIDPIKNIKILGVRKNRIKEIQGMDNWIWIEDKLKEETAKISDQHIASLVVAEMLDSYYNKVYTNKTVAKLVGPDSEYAKYVTKYGSIKRVAGNITQLVALCGKYGKAVQVEAVKKDIEDTKVSLYTKYPLLKLVRDGVDVKEAEVADYIKMVDNMEKI